jgi:hypothetical protein
MDAETIGVVAVQAVVVGVVGLMQRGLWAWVHGAEQTRRSAVWLALVSGPALAAAEMIAGMTTSDALPVALIAGATLAAIQALWRVTAEEPLLAPDAAPAPPVIVAEGFEVRSEHVSHAALGTILAVGLVPLGVGLVLAPLWKVVGARRVRVVVRGGDLVVGNERIRLTGAAVGSTLRADGTPVVRVSREGAVLDVPMGGHPPSERARLAAMLARLAQRRDHAVPEAPEALTRLRTRRSASE